MGRMKTVRLRYNTSSTALARTAQVYRAFHATGEVQAGPTGWAKYTVEHFHGISQKVEEEPLLQSALDCEKRMLVVCTTFCPSSH